ncbi:MAG TPA: OsmC family protein [Candidatus Desulfaltia sp.]|nr:OsmC family protein [Candidatus Desulfaltia sp.]
MGPLYPKELEYLAEARWDGSTGGVAEAGGFRVSFDTPPEYGGKGSAPCPDQLFLSALGGCLLNTFVSFKNRLGAETVDASVSASCRIELWGREGYRLASVSAVLNITSAPGMEELNRRCAELAVEHCHLTRSIEVAVPVNCVIRVESRQT